MKAAHLPPNLLPVLDALLRERSVTRAATLLGRTQSAVSDSLAQLREVLRDPLLVRVGRTMELTIRAQNMLGRVRAACEAIEDACRVPTDAFDPKTENRNFVIAAMDYGCALLGPRLADRLHHDSTQLSVQFVDPSIGADTGRHWANVDFILLPRSRIKSQAADISFVPLFSDDFVAVVGPQHRLAGDVCGDFARYTSEPHIFFYPGIEPVQFGSFGNLNWAGRRTVARLPYFGILSLMALTTECIVIMPRRMFAQLQAFVPLHSLYNPFPGVTAQICLAWNVIHDADPAHRWFRTLIKEVATELTDQDCEPS